MTNQEIQQAASEHANKHWDVLEKPNEHDNSRDDFIAGAQWAKSKQLQELEEAKEILIILRKAAELDGRTESVKFINDFLGKLGY